MFNRQQYLCIFFFFFSIRWPESTLPCYTLDWDLVIHSLYFCSESETVQVGTLFKTESRTLLTFLWGAALSKILWLSTWKYLEIPSTFGYLENLPTATLCPSLPHMLSLCVVCHLTQVSTNNSISTGWCCTQPIFIKSTLLMENAPKCTMHRAHFFHGFFWTETSQLLTYVHLLKNTWRVMLSPKIKHVRLDELFYSICKNKASRYFKNILKYWAKLPGDIQAIILQLLYKHWQRQHSCPKESFSFKSHATGVCHPPV